ncbi:MAG: damage-control phosphatase ARMT1 family protein [Candidatus Limivicinus sp.]|jgi:uncharacterized protein with ATP-grasp and redox domains
MARLRSECILCLLRHHLDASYDAAAEDVRREYIQKLMGILASADRNTSTPLVIDRIVEMRKDYFPLADDYTEIKRHFNALMMEYEPEARKKIAASDDPIRSALQFSMVGNFIDFGALDSVDETQLRGLLMGCDSIEVDETEYRRFREDLKTAGRLVLLSDNCGEIVMDKLLLEEIHMRYPRIKISVIVRGEPVINDATMEDACQIGLADEFEVLGSGSGLGGTVPERLSPESGAAFEAADIIISKGQGNFEALHHCGRNVYYAFLCKCMMFAEIFHTKQFSGIFVSDDRLMREIVI